MEGIHQMFNVQPQQSSFFPVLGTLFFQRLQHPSAPIHSQTQPTEEAVNMDVDVQKYDVWGQIEI